MKKIVFTILLACLFLTNSCENYIYQSYPSITTEEATFITYYSAYLGFDCTDIYFYCTDIYYDWRYDNAIKEIGVLYGTISEPTLSNSTIVGFTVEEFQKKKDKEYYYASTYVKDLSEETIYYYRAYALDQDDNFVYGKIKSFTTLARPLASISTGSARQTGSNYSSTGSYYGYRYRFEWRANLYLTNYQNVTKIGFIFSDNSSWPISSFNSDGTYSYSWYTYANYSSISRSYQAFADLINGDRIFGTERTITLKYGQTGLLSTMSKEISHELDCLIEAYNDK